MRAHLVHGLVAGLLAGIAAFAVAYVVGEPSIDSAIAIEESGAAESVHTHESGETHSHESGEAAHSHGDEGAVVSRTAQSTGGLLTATVVLGTALGGVVGLAAAFATGRLGRLRAPTTAALVAALGFVGYYLVPYLKYPPNPPAVGSADTIGARSADYFSMVVVSVAAIVLAVVVARRVAASRGALTGVVTGAAGYLVVVVLAAVLLRSHQEVPDTFPAALLWEFRTASLAVQATMWAVLGTVLAGLLERDARRAVRGSREPVAA